MIINNQTGDALRPYVQPSIEVLDIEIDIPLCMSGGATTEDYVVDDVFGEG